jgi:pectate lyase
MFVLALLAIPLFGGAQCSFFFSSGGGNDNPEDKQADAGLVIIVGDGTLVDAPVEGVYYESGSLAGITGSNGEFRYEVGNTIRFFIGDITLGEPVTGKAVITPVDLVPNGTADTPAVVNIARLLQSLDSEPGDEIITIPPEVRAAAVRSNETLSSAIEFLDFSDEPAFVNAASQLVAVLASDYPFTAVLVDADQARTHMAKSLGKLGQGHKTP